MLPWEISLGDKDMETKKTDCEKKKNVFSLTNLPFVIVICRPQNTEHKRVAKKYCSTLTMAY